MMTRNYSNFDEGVQLLTRQRICQKIDHLVRIYSINEGMDNEPKWRNIIDALYSMPPELGSPLLPFFDADWYSNTYKITKKSVKDAFQHYVSQGAALAYSPGPNFHAKAYLQHYPDVAEAKHDPLMHFLLHGAREGRNFFIHVDAQGSIVNQSATRFPTPVDPDQLVRLQDPWTLEKADSLRRAVHSCIVKPCVSIIMPVYQPDMLHLQAAINSVGAQIYEDWQLCIADDDTGCEQLKTYLTELAKDTRVNITIRTSRGHISAATNTAAASASGEFFLLLDQDDILAPDALARCVLSLNSRAGVDYIYSDADKIGSDGQHYDVERKPAFSPELLLSYMYAGHLLCVRATLWRKLGGMRTGFEGSQDHDFALRATELARVVVHIPEVLYHWRAAPGSTATDGRSKPFSFAAGQRAVQEAFDRRKVPAQVVRTPWAISNGLAAFKATFPNDGPTVGIVIPTRNRLYLLRCCIESLRTTNYRNFRVLVVDNASNEPEVISYLENLTGTQPFPIEVVHISNPQGGFNYSYLVNRGVELLDTEFIVLLNNDTKVIDADWLSSMIGYGRLPGVGAVGCLLLYPNGLIQHGGVFISDQPHLWAGHLAKGSSPETGSIKSAFNVAAVTAACMLVSRATYWSVGGFDERSFAVAYNDVDFCLRLSIAGKRSVMVPDAKLYHYEGQSRGYRDDPAELASLIARHGPLHDPCLSPHLMVAELPLRIPRRLAMVSDRPERILVATHNLNREGAPIALLEACVCLVEKYGVFIKVISSQDGPLRDEFMTSGMEVEVMLPPWQGSKNVSAYEDETFLFGRRLRREGFDLIIANTLLSFHAIDAAHGAGVPSVWWIHENDGVEAHFGSLISDVRRRAMACFGHPYRTIFVAIATLRRYAALNFHHNALVIPGGIDSSWASDVNSEMRDVERRRMGLGSNQTVVLTIGTICARKRQRDVLASFVIAAGVNPELVLVIAGPKEPSYFDALSADIEHLEPTLRNRIDIVPSTSEVKRLYAAADIFVLASEDESYPRTILEAMAAGLPILACPVGGIEEQVRAGVNAELFSPGDIENLARLIEKFALEPMTRQRYGLASISVSKSLNTSERASEALWAILREAVLTSPPPSRLSQF